MIPHSLHLIDVFIENKSDWHKLDNPKAWGFVCLKAQGLWLVGHTVDAGLWQAALWLADWCNDASVTHPLFWAGWHGVLTFRLLGDHHYVITAARIHCCHHPLPSLWSTQVCLASQSLEAENSIYVSVWVNDGFYQTITIHSHIFCSSLPVLVQLRGLSVFIVAPTHVGEY